MAQNTKAKQIISKIMETLNSPNNYDESFYSFKYDENIKNEEDYKLLDKNPGITLYGNDKINTYNDLFCQLYKEMNIKNKKLSLKFFKERTQQLLFYNKFDYDNIKSKIDSSIQATYFNVMMIYGMSMDEEIITYGKYTFVNKNKILDFINGKITTDKYKAMSEHSLRLIEEENNKNIPLIYLIISYNALDSVFAQEEFNIESVQVINTLRYMAGIKNKRVEISNKEFISTIKKQIQFTNNMVLLGTKIDIKDIDIKLDYEYFNSEENGNQKIWQILNKDNRNDLENRILNAISWIGMSIFEESNNIACCELAFAFEALLTKHIKDTPISASIQGSISEIVAYICGNSLEERLSIISSFKNFYSMRSALVHGGNKQFSDKMYIEYLQLIKKCIMRILKEEKFNDCTNTEQLYVVIDKYKFRS